MVSNQVTISFDTEDSDRHAMLTSQHHVWDIRNEKRCLISLFYTESAQCQKCNLQEVKDWLVATGEMKKETKENWKSALERQEVYEGVLILFSLHNVLLNV